jgi:predicted Zn-dependent protease
MRHLRTSGAFAAPLLALLAACTSVSGTNRSQLNLLSEAEERSLGDQAYGEALGEKGVKVITSGADVDRVRRVGARIQAASARLHPKAVRGFDWTWTVVDDPKQVNAWMLPGGKSVVYTGILRVATSDDQLAVVMGHEASHAIARHGGERISSDMVLNGALTGASMALGNLDAPTQAAVMQALGVGGTVGVALPWSRMQESEADELGLLIAADAGYDPRAAIPFWTQMAASGSNSKPPEFLSTHPDDETRVKRLRALLPKALRTYAAAISRDGGPAPGSLPLGPPPATPAAAAKKN